MSDEVEKTEEGSAPLTAQTLIRNTADEKDRWKAAAEKHGKTMTDFIRDTLNAAAREVLECQHPLEYRKTYPWSSTCTRCGERLMG